MSTRKNTLSRQLLSDKISVIAFRLGKNTNGKEQIKRSGRANRYGYGGRLAIHDPLLDYNGDLLQPLPIYSCEVDTAYDIANLNWCHVLITAVGCHCFTFKYSIDAVPKKKKKKGKE